jgi:ABC-2 type transport system permease protein
MVFDKSMIVARADLGMAMKVRYVKYGLIGMGALGPAMALLLVVSLAGLGAPAEVLAFMSPMIAAVIGMMSIIPASLISANALVGEREQNTLEPLLATPLTDTELLVGKLLSSFIPSMALLIAGVVVAEVGSYILLLAMGLTPFLIIDLSGFVLLLAAAPAMILAVTSVMILLSGRVKRVYEAYQTSGAIILVFMIPMILPMTALSDTGVGDPAAVQALSWFSTLVTLLIAVVLMVVTWSLALRRFNRDTMVSSV